LIDKPRFLFDECIGFPLVEQLADLLGVSSQEVDLGHAVKLGFGGINDDVWIPQIASDGWTIISGDRGAQQKAFKGEKLPIVCRQFGITHAILSRSVNKLKSFMKIRALLATWDDLLGAHSGPRGCGYALKMTSQGHFALRKNYDPVDGALPKRQGGLFNDPQ
jgi:hypothetical protein